jgi:hypothetical protein
MPQKLGQLVAAHLERKELTDALLSRGGHPPNELGPERGVSVLIRRRGDNVLYFCGVPVVQELDHVEELGLLAADAGQEKLLLGFGESHDWQYSHSGYLCWW